MTSTPIKPRMSEYLGNHPDSGPMSPLAVMSPFEKTFGCFDRGEEEVIFDKGVVFLQTIYIEVIDMFF